MRHRGLGAGGEGLPNSFESVLRNYHASQEADAILLSDGEVAVLHERDFGLSITDTETMNLSAVEALDIPSKNSEEHGRKVPLLEEFVGLAADAGTAVALELKASSKEKVLALIEAIVQKLAAMKAAGGLKGNENFIEDGISFESFSVEALKALHARTAQDNLVVRTTLYWPSNESWARKVALFDWTALETVPGRASLEWHSLGIHVAKVNAVSMIELQPHEITQELVTEAHADGVRIAASLVKDPEEAKRLFALGVDRVMVE